MARLTDDDREDILADWHTGIYSKNELAKRYDTSHTTINKLTKGIEPKFQEQVSTVATIKAEFAEESFKQVSAIETAIEEKTKHLQLINNVAAYGVSLIGKKMKKLGEEMSMTDLKQGIEAVDRASITLKVSDRHAPKGDINVNATAATQNNYNVLSDEEIQEEMKKRGIPSHLKTLIS